MSNPQQSRAGGKQKAPNLSGLSIIIEGSSKSLIGDVCRIVVERLKKHGGGIVTDKDLQSNDERILVANQRLLDAAAVTLAPETSSLFVAIKLQPRLQLIQRARAEGLTVLQSVSWLGDAVYYQALGNTPVVDNIMRDFSAMKPDIWIVIDDPNSPYMNLGKRIGADTYSSERSAASLATSIYDFLLNYKPKKSPNKLDSDQHSRSYSRLAVAYLLSNQSSLMRSDLNTLIDTSNYYRPANLGNKVLGAYDTLMKKIILNHEAAQKKVQKHLKAEVDQNNELKAEQQLSEMLPLSLSVAEVTSQNGTQLPAEKEIISPTSNRIIKLAEELLPQQLDSTTRPGAKLISFWPINELDLSTPILYPAANLGEREIRSVVGGMPYSQKEQIIRSYLKQTTNKVLKRAIYTWDLITDFQTIYELLSLGCYVSASLQPASPRYGYEMPDIIEKSEAGDIYQQSFDLSMELYSLLQSAGFPDEAQYAVLNGHRVRCELVISAAAMIYLIKKQPKSERLQKLIKEMCSEVAETHPLIAETFHKNL